MAELDDLREHLERYRAVTLQSLDLVTDQDLGWRPESDHYTLGQQFLHIAQSEDFQIQAHLFGVYSLKLRLKEAGIPPPPPGPCRTWR